MPRSPVARHWTRSTARPRAPLDLEPDKHEEDRHQPVVNPKQQRLGNGETNDLDRHREIQELRVECLDGEFAKTSAFAAAAQRATPPADSSLRSC
jgi:hypothetical protein